MPRRIWVLSVLVVVCWAVLSVPKTRPARAQFDPPPIPAKAFILVDADSGRVLDAQNEHEALPPASTQKLMTALVATEKLSRDAVFAVGTTPTAQPAMRIGMRLGESWSFGPALHALLMVSANDAAYALAEAASGSLANFAADMNVAAARYGMKDSVFNDPAGFDDAASYNGGSRASAYDLAIAARNTLAVPELVDIAALPEYRFTGPSGQQHRLLNHNRLLKRYAGAIGLKTGYTRQAGHTFVGAATREGRTMIAVVLNSKDTYGLAAALLDRGFAIPRDAGGTGDRLPQPRVKPYEPPLSSTLVAAGKSPPKPGSTVKGSNGGGNWGRPALLLAVGSAATSAGLRRRMLRQRQARAERRRQQAELRRRELLQLNDPEGWDAGCRAQVPGQYEAL
jgi:serine-type D-Ala-D-Ala carboxypeptidase (penicillin-binding protein 5/6)